MLKLTVAFLLGLLQLISCQNYDELLTDPCFRKIYVCGDHRSGVTGSSERFETDPHKLKEICRKNEKFIACVDDAVSNNCNDSISDLALVTWSNRISLKMFCTNLEWRKNYFSSVSCINENVYNVKKDCEHEESIHVDDRPWCLRAEQCNAFQRVLKCTVQKMKELCGETAAEVFRRIQILNSEDQDVVCEYRRQNPSFCRYERQKRHIDADPQDRVASSSGLPEKYETEAMYNVVKSLLIDAVKNLDEQRQQDFSGIVDSDKVKLRKLLSIAGESPNPVENGSKIFKRVGFLKNNPDSKVPENLSGYSVTESSTESNLKPNKDINTKSDSDSEELEYSPTTRSQLRRIERAIHRIRTKTMKKKQKAHEKLIPDHLVGTDDDPFYDTLEDIKYNNQYDIYREIELRYFMEQMEKMRAHQRELTKLSREKEVESLNRERERVREIERHANEKYLERLNRGERYRERKLEALKEENEAIIAREKEEKEFERKLRHARSKKINMAYYDVDEGKRNGQETEKSEKELHAGDKEQPIQNQI